MATPTCGERYPFISADWYGDVLALNHLGPCSGHGVCSNSTGLCTCDEGWTGLSDLINTDGIDCHINELVIKLEWAFVVLLAIVLMVTTIPSFLDKHRKHAELKIRRKAQGKSYSIWKNNRTLVAMYLYTFGCFPSIVCLGLLRIAVPTERAGVTFGYTFFFFTGKLTFYIAALVFQPALLASLLSGSKSQKAFIDRMVKLGYYTQYFTFTLSILAALAPVVIIIEGSGGVSVFSQVVYLVYLLFQTISMVILFVMSVEVKKRAWTLFTQSYKMTQDDKTLALKEQVNALEKKAIISSCIIGLVYLAYIIFPILWNKHDYVFPITWLPFVIVGKEINSQNVKEKRSSKSGRNGSKNSKTDGSQTSLPQTRSFRSMITPKFGKGGSKKKDKDGNGFVSGPPTDMEPVSHINSKDDDGFV